MADEDRYKEFKQYLASVELGVEGRARLVDSYRFAGCGAVETVGVSA